MITSKFLYAILLYLLSESYCNFSSHFDDFDDFDQSWYRVHQGIEVPDGKYPFAVSLLTWDLAHVCGASILSNFYVITACRCVCEGRGECEHGKPPLRVGYVLAGDTDLNERSENEQKRRIDRYYAHPDCVVEPDTVATNDISILQVDEQFKFNEYVWQVQLPFDSKTVYVDLNNMTEESLICTTMGWGLNEKKFTSILMEIYIPLLSFDVCSRAMHKLKVKLDSKSQICTEVLEGRDACEGDMGGPLFCDGYLIGIVSYGILCGVENNPAIFANIVGMKSFIRSILWPTEEPELHSTVRMCKIDFKTFSIILIIFFLL